MSANLDVFMATMLGHAQSVSPELACAVVKEHYGLDVTAERLTGERDENFKMRAPDGREYVFKIANAAEDPAITDLSTAALLRMEVADAGFPCPRVQRTRTRQTHTSFKDSAGLQRTGRLVTYLQGKPLRYAQRSAQQRERCGRLAACLGRALRGFEHPASRRVLVWDLKQIPELGSLLKELPDLHRGAFIADFIRTFAADIAPRLDSLRHQFIHNDLNDRNVLVDPKDESIVTGIIDFGDAVHTALIADVAIAAVAHITSLDTLETNVRDFVNAYRDVEPLLPEELAILNWLIAGRIVTGVLIPSWHRARNPGANHFDAFSAEHIDRRIALIEALLNQRGYT